MAPTDLNDSIYDVLGLGFGPANLSVATALAEAWSVKKVGLAVIPCCYFGTHHSPQSSLMMHQPVPLGTPFSSTNIMNSSGTPACCFQMRECKLGALLWRNIQRVFSWVLFSFMKDLATLRNPQSPFTFLAYLHSQDRLLSFINRGSNIPTRKEFSDYLSWAAQRVQKEGVEVIFGHEVVGVSEGPQDTIQVRTKNLSTGEERLFRARE